MTRANANPELPGHLPGAGKTRSKVNRSRSAAGAGLGAQRRGRVARIEVGTSGSLVRPPACRATRRQSCRPPAPPPAATAAVGPIYGSAAAGSGPERQAESGTRPCAHLRCTRYYPLALQAVPCGSDSTELRAMRPGRARGPGRRRARRAPTWPTGQRLLLAPPRRAKLRVGAGGGGPGDFPERRNR